MKNKIRIIICFFGKFPNTIQEFLYSCKMNSEFEWLIFTDDILNNVPQNVRVIHCRLTDIKNLIENKLQMEVSLDAPYKLCDFRPAFGVIFEEYLQGYDFWGYGDIDLVYGKLSKFITDDLCKQYDKIFPCGHLSLVRNTEKCNNAFLADISGTLNYEEVFKNGKSYIFDEYKGLNEKLLAIGGSVYGKIDFVDIDIIYNRFRLADKRTIRNVFPGYLFTKYLQRNYSHQIFYFLNGHTYHAYLDKNKKITEKEVAYIHYRRKINSNIDIIKNSNFYITSTGFVKMNDAVTVELIDQLNNYPGVLFETKEFLKFKKEQLIHKLGKNTLLRNTIRVLKGKKRLS